MTDSRVDSGIHTHEFLHQISIVNMVTVKTKDFGNARDVRKLLDKTLERQSVRIQALPDSISPCELSESL